MNQPITRFTAMLNESVREDASIQGRLGVCLNRMIELQMQAYPSCWGDVERREEAEKFIYGCVK